MIRNPQNALKVSTQAQTTRSPMWSGLKAALASCASALCLALPVSALADDAGGLKKIIAIQEARMRDFQTKLDAVTREMKKVKTAGPNLWANSDFLEVESNGVPKGWTSYGSGNNIAVNVLHPYTSGFIGPYVGSGSKPASSLPPERADEATENSPIWYGEHHTGPRISRWGWGAQPFKVLKASFSGPGEFAMFVAHSAQHISGPASRYRASMYVKFIKGTKFGISQDVGGNGLVVDRATCDKEPQRWCLVSGELYGSNTNGIYLGFGRPSAGGNREDLEVLVALPYITPVDALWVK